MPPLSPIAHIKSAFPTKFGIPRQSNVVMSLKSAIVFEEEYRNLDALRGLEDFSHIWLIWDFSETRKDSWSPTVRPPRLGGNSRMGVFATRSPFRPNPIGLSCVKLDHIEQHPQLGPVIHVLGADLMDGTPIYDIKPYVPYTDCHQEAVGGFACEPPAPRLKVSAPGDLTAHLPDGLWDTLRELLEHDPRPSYHDDPARVYGMEFGGFEARFSVSGDMLTVLGIINTGSLPDTGKKNVEG